MTKPLKTRDKRKSILKAASQTEPTTGWRTPSIGPRAMARQWRAGGQGQRVRAEGEELPAQHSTGLNSPYRNKGRTKTFSGEGKVKGLVTGRPAPKGYYSDRKERTAGDL